MHLKPGHRLSTFTIHKSQGFEVRNCDSFSFILDDELPGFSSSQVAEMFSKWQVFAKRFQMLISDQRL